MFGQTAKVVQFITLAPAIISLVNMLVQAFESEGNGDQKKKAVLDAVKVVYDTTAQFMLIKVPFSYINALASEVIDLVVGFYNLIGHFKHTKKEDIPSVEVPAAPVEEPVSEPAPVEVAPVDDTPVQAEPVQEPVVEPAPVVEAPADPQPEPVAEPVQDPQPVQEAPVETTEPAPAPEQPAPVVEAPVAQPAPVAPVQDPSQAAVQS